MTKGYFSSTNIYKKLSEEEREKLKVQMSENYYRKTEGKVKRETTPRKFIKNHKYKSRSPHIKEETK